MRRCPAKMSCEDVVRRCRAKMSCKDVVRRCCGVQTDELAEPREARRRPANQELTSDLSKTKVENSICRQMGYFERIASPRPDTEASLHFQIGGAARHVVIQCLYLTIWPAFLYIRHCPQATPSKASSCTPSRSSWSAGGMRWLAQR